MGERLAAARPLVSLVIGFALAAVGMDTVSGNLRLTFDSTDADDAASAS